jgi:hypothetical protein
MEMVANGIEPPLHTLQGWSARGYRVKKGEHAVTEAKLWKKKKRKQDGTDPSAEEAEAGGADRDFYMCRSYLFGAEQVERAEGER